MDCTVCGSSIEAGEVECSACEAGVALSEVIPSSDQLAKFGLLRELDGLDELLRHTPSGWNWISASLSKVALGLVITLMAIATVLLFKFLESFLQFVLAFFCVLGGAGLIVNGLSCLAELADSSLERFPSIVLGTTEFQTRIPGVHLHYLALLTSGPGKRAVRVRGALLKELGKGDAGVAYAKGAYLLDFKRVNLPQA